MSTVTPIKSDFSKFFQSLKTPLTDAEKYAAAKEKIDFLENVLDILYYEKLDFKELCNIYYLNLAATEARETALAERLPKIKEEAEASISEWRSRVYTAVEEDKTIEKNYQHALATIGQHTQTIKLVKAEIDKLRAEKVNNEHLAKKLLETYEENSRLKEDLRNTKPADESEQLIQYKTQVTRLIEEKASYDCNADATGKTPCGQCLTCRMKQREAIFSQTVENFQKFKEEFEYYKTNRNALTNQIDDITAKVNSMENIALLYEDTLETIAKSNFLSKNGKLAREALKEARRQLNGMQLFEK